MNARLQQCARHADLSGPKHTASAQHERMPRHSVSYTRKPLLTRATAALPYALICVEFFAGQSLAEREDQVDGGLREPGRAAVLPPLRHNATNARRSQGRTWDAAATRLCSDAVTSATLRVFSPQSGLTHSRCAGTAFSAARSDSAISAVDGTRGEWMS